MDQAPSVSHPESAHTSGEPGSKGRHWWIWVIVLALFGLLFYWVLHQHAQSQDQGGSGGTAGGPGAGRRGGRGGAGGAVPVTSAKATLGDLGVYLNAIGTVTPVYTNNITSQVTGVITAVHYREGQYVHKGDPLIEIDARPYQAQLAQAQGTLERDQNLLAQARWTWRATRRHGARTPSRGRRLKTRKSSCCRTKAP